MPALGALAAEPLYLLADTAMVGHLGTEELAALAIAATLLVGAFTLFNFLTYGTTAQVARLSGAAEHAQAGRLAAQALWLASGIGVVLTAAIAALAGAARGAHGRRGEGRGAGRDLSPDRLARAAVRIDRAVRAGLPARRLGPAHAAHHRRRGERGQRRPERAVHLRLRLGPGGFRLGDRGRAARHGRGVRGRVAPPPRRLTPAVARRDAPADADRGSDLRSYRFSLCLLRRGERGAREGGRRFARRPPDRLPAVRLPGPRARRDRDRRAGDRGALARGGRLRGGLPGRAPDDRVGRGGGSPVRGRSCWL